MQVKTNELTGAALDWAVTKIEAERKPFVVYPEYITNYSSDWAQGGPIIEREITKLFRNVGGSFSAMIIKEVPIPPEERGTSLALTVRRQWNGAGPTPLIAAMRCYVASKLGDTVDVPDELIAGE